MHDYLLSLLLGIVEGLTEFLPVSSTAHLRLVEGALNISLKSDFWKIYSIVIQLGAILTLPVYFRKRIAQFIRTFPKGERGDRTVLTHPLTLVLVAFVVTAIPAFVLSKLIKDNLESLHVIATSLVVGGIVMWIVDAFFKAPKTLHMEEMTLPQAIWIGACQILSAVFPGTSRSMSTIAAGQVAGMSRESALEFSFFLSIPTMVVATGFAGLKLVKAAFSHGPVSGSDALSGPIVMGAHEWITLAIGFVVSFIVAFAVIAWFMNWVKKHGFVPFAIYRIVLGGGLLVYLLTHP